MLDVIYLTLDDFVPGRMKVMASRIEGMNGMVNKGRGTRG